MMNKSDIYALKQIKGVGDKSILNVISSKLGLKPHEVISIGDEEKDIIASNNAGAISVLVKWGNSGNNNYAANYHCKSVDELKRILFEN